MTDKTSMTYWFPLLKAAGIPVPETIMVSMPEGLCQNIRMVLYGEKPERDPREYSFFVELRLAVEKIGTPCFLRTAMTSAKHSWDNTCFLSNTDDLVKHVYAIAEFSEIADFCGLPFDTWFVRELLPSIKFGSCPRYDNMPVAREFRFFVDNGKIRCFHPYWPLTALEDGGWTGDKNAYAPLCDPTGHIKATSDLALRVSAAIDGSWSVDILETERGWFVTDMAEAHKSYHWEGCQYDKESA
jgi:hypothetical protein